jgi:ATP-dependent RNA helicase DeaD
MIATEEKEEKEEILEAQEMAGASRNFGGDGSTRYFINIGEKDGYDWMSLKDFLRDTVNLGKDDIFKVDVKESFSFFNSEANVEEAILSTFKDLKVDGRFVNVEVSNNPIGGGSSRGGGGFKGRGRSGSGGGGGFRNKERGGYKGGGSSRSDRPSRSSSSDRSDSGRRGSRDGGSRDGGKSFGGSPFSENKKGKRRNGFM